MKLGYKTAWLLLFIAVLVAFVIIFVPVWLIQPFAPQTTRSIEVSYILKSWSPVLTILLALAVHSACGLHLVAVEAVVREGGSHSANISCYCFCLVRPSESF